MRFQRAFDYFLIGLVLLLIMVAGWQQKEFRERNAVLKDALEANAEVMSLLAYEPFNGATFEVKTWVVKKYLPKNGYDIIEVRFQEIGIEEPTFFRMKCKIAFPGLPVAPFTFNFAEPSTVNP